MSNYQKGSRLRVFAGPNGSGKSTIVSEIQANYDLGHYLNADDIEQTLRSENQIDLAAYGLTESQVESISIKLPTHSIFKKATSDGFEIDLKIEGSIISSPNNKTHSYEASLIADLVRNELIVKGQKFAFETVMSHESKVEFMRKTKSAGYKNYLYFICTEDPTINIGRVNSRVQMGGHPVDKQKIIDRYYRSLKLARNAIDQTYRTFVFDNSEQEFRLILEVFEGREVTFLDSKIPNWVDEYILG